MEESHNHGQNTDRLAPKTGKVDKANNPAVRGVEVKINKTERLIQYVYLLICKPKKIVAKLSVTPIFFCPSYLRYRDKFEKSE
jgi:hypothetical protein